MTGTQSNAVIWTFLAAWVVLSHKKDRQLKWNIPFFHTRAEIPLISMFNQIREFVGMLSPLITDLYFFLLQWLSNAFHPACAATFGYYSAECGSKLDGQFYLFNASAVFLILLWYKCSFLSLSHYITGIYSIYLQRFYTSCWELYLYFWVKICLTILAVFTTPNSLILIDTKCEISRLHDLWPVNGCVFGTLALSNASHYVYDLNFTASFVNYLLLIAFAWG